MSQEEPLVEFVKTVALRLRTKMFCEKLFDLLNDTERQVVELSWGVRADDHRPRSIYEIASATNLTVADVLRIKCEAMDKMVRSDHFKTGSDLMTELGLTSPSKS